MTKEEKENGEKGKLGQSPPDNRAVTHRIKALMEELENPLHLFEFTQ